MSSEDEVKQYLAGASAGGEVDSDGVFTIAPAEALRKIAQFQLPEGLWALKIIQSVVASGSTKPIEISQVSNSIVFKFQEPGFTLDELASTFFNPVPPANRSLYYLLIGLWSVGIGSKWGFEVSLTSEASILAWDGRGLHKLEQKKKRRANYCSIKVTTGGDEASSSLFSAGVSALERNASMLRVVEKFCFMCPMPLVMSFMPSKRIDMLQKVNSAQGRSGSSTLAVEVVDAPLPLWGMPPGTYEMEEERLKEEPVIFQENQVLLSEMRQRARAKMVPLCKGEMGMGELWREVALGQMKGLCACKTTAVAYALNINMAQKEMSSGSSEGLAVASKAPCEVYWVLDGAVIQVERIIDGTYFCSLAVFISAEGLKTDFSTLKLVECAEKEERIRVACLALKDSIKGKTSIRGLSSMVKRLSHDRMRFGAVALIGSVLSFGAVFGGVAGSGHLIAAGSMLGLGAVYSLFFAAGQYAGQVELFKSSVNEIHARLSEKYQPSA